MHRPLLLVAVLIAASTVLVGQTSVADSPTVPPADAPATVMLGGEEMEVIIGEDGDTLYLAKRLADVSVSSPRKFESKEDYKLYLKYRYYAPKVYPYAVQAIRIFRETAYVTETMPKRKAKRHVRRLQKELKKEFEDPLKKLTKTQGYLLVKMIEKETDTPMHELIKDLRGPVTATYWSTMGKMFGHQLRDGYVVGENPILDVVLQDYDVSHVVADGSAPQGPGRGQRLGSRRAYGVCGSVLAAFGVQLCTAIGRDVSLSAAAPPKRPVYVLHPRYPRPPVRPRGPPPPGPPTQRHDAPPRT